jgi:hypothetical protein
VEMLQDETNAAREAINMLHRHLDSAVAERDSLLLIHKQPNVNILTFVICLIRIFLVMRHSK